jgi:hypothetical protein
MMMAPLARYLLTMVHWGSEGRRCLISACGSEWRDYVDLFCRPSLGQLFYARRLSVVGVRKLAVNVSAINCQNWRGCDARKEQK